MITRKKVPPQKEFCCLVCFVPHSVLIISEEVKSEGFHSKTFMKEFPGFTSPGNSWSYSASYGKHVLAGEWNEWRGSPPAAPDLSCPQHKGEESVIYLHSSCWWSLSKANGIKSGVIIFESHSSFGERCHYWFFSSVSCIHFHLYICRWESAKNWKVLTVFLEDIFVEHSGISNSKCVSSCQSWISFP